MQEPRLGGRRAIINQESSLYPVPPPTRTCRSVCATVTSVPFWIAQPNPAAHPHTYLYGNTPSPKQAFAKSTFFLSRTHFRIDRTFSIPSTRRICHRLSVPFFLLIFNSFWSFIGSWSIEISTIPHRLPFVDHADRPTFCPILLPQFDNGHGLCSGFQVLSYVHFLLGPVESPELWIR